MYSKNPVLPGFCVFGLCDEIRLVHGTGRVGAGWVWTSFCHLALHDVIAGTPLELVH